MILRDFDFCWKSPTYKNNDFPILGNTNGSNCNELNILQKIENRRMELLFVHYELYRIQIHWDRTS